MRILLILFLLANTYLFASDASMEIIKKGTNLPNISINIASNSNNKLYAKKIEHIIYQDLLVSGHFDVKLAKKPMFFSSSPNYLTQSKKNIDLLLNLKVTKDDSQRHIVEVKLFDINKKDQVLRVAYSSKILSRYPFLGHKISIALNTYIKAPSIDWMNKFVIFAKYLSAKESEIVVSDYTLTFQQVIVRGGLNIFPKWANPAQSAFYYTTYNYKKPTLMKVNLYTGNQRKIISSNGMIVCSDISRLGNKILLTMAPNGQPDIYLYNTKTRIKTKLTSYLGIDVGGHFVENATKIVFISDRLGYPNIFAKGLRQRGVERLVYHGKNNSSVTTYKDYIVYTSRETDNEFSNNTFNLYLISTKSDYIRRLTLNGKNQFPKFSNDGESILFTKNYKGKSSLGIIRLNYNKSFLFPLKVGKLQSIDW